MQRCEDMFTVIYAATQHYVVLRASSCEAMRSFRFPSQMNKSDDSFHDDASNCDCRRSQKKWKDFKEFKEPVATKKPPKVYYAEESSLSSPISDELNQFAQTVRKMKVDDLKLCENNFFTVDKLGCLLENFCVFKHDESLDSFEVFDGHLSELSSMNSDEECIIIVKKPVSIDPIFEDTFCRTFTSTPRKDTANLSTESFLYSLQMLQRFSIPVVNQVYEDVEPCKTHLHFQTENPIVTFLDIKMKAPVDFSSVAFETQDERLEFVGRAMMVNLAEMTSNLTSFKGSVASIRAKLKRRIPKLFRTGISQSFICVDLLDLVLKLTEDQEMNLARTFANRKHLQKVTSLELDIKKQIKFHRNISHNILDTHKYQPLNQIMKKLAQETMIECKGDTHGKTKKIAKVKCKKCNGTISSVRFLTSRSSCDDHVADSTKLTPTATAESGSGLQNSFPSYYTKPESTPFPFTETIPLVSLTRLLDYQEGDNAPVRSKLRRNNRRQTVNKFEQKPVVNLVTKTDSFLRDMGSMYCEGNSFKDLHFRDPSRPSNPQLRHSRRSVTYSSGLEDTESMLLAQFSSETKNCVLVVPRLQLDVTQDTETGVPTTTTGYDTRPPSSNICQFGDTQREEVTSQSCNSHHQLTRATQKPSIASTSSIQIKSRPVVQHRLKYKTVPSYRIARENQQNLHRSRRISQTNALETNGDSKPNQKQTFQYKPNVKMEKTQESKRKVNFQVPSKLEKADLKTPVLASALSLADAADVLAVIERIKRNGKSKALKNSSAEKLEEIFQSQFLRVASYLHDNF